MVMGACPGQTPISSVPLTLMVTATMVRARRYIEISFLATTEGSLRSASLNGFKRADPLVIDAKYDLALVGDVYAEFLSFNKSLMY